ncbi:hypothetical protein AVEN_101987-1, partial [Araneus ventricosus]
SFCCCVSDYVQPQGTSTLWYSDFDCKSHRIWDIKRHRTVRKMIRHCIKCKRFNAKYAEVNLTPLPEDRIKDAAIYEVTGIDLDVQSS